MREVITQYLCLHPLLETEPQLVLSTQSWASVAQVGSPSGNWAPSWASQHLPGILHPHLFFQASSQYLPSGGNPVWNVCKIHNNETMENDARYTCHLYFLLDIYVSSSYHEVDYIKFLMHCSSQSKILE